MHRSAACAFALATLAAPAHASDRGVVIGEVSSNVTRRGVDYEILLRSASEEEVLSLDLRRVPRERRVIVSVALVRLDVDADPRAAGASCKVSATVRDARKGAVFAILEGEARATGQGSAGAAEATAVRGALHGALAHIPELLAR